MFRRVMKGVAPAAARFLSSSNGGRKLPKKVTVSVFGSQNSKQEVGEGSEKDKESSHATEAAATEHEKRKGDNDPCYWGVSF